MGPPSQKKSLWGTWGLEGDSGLGATLVPNSACIAVTPVNPVYARHLTVTDGLSLYVYHTSGDLQQAQTVW